MLWHNRPLLAACVVVAATYIGVGMVGPVRVLFAESHGASLAVIGGMASSYLIANFLGQYPVGSLADRWNRKWIIAIGLGAQAVLTIAYLAVTDPLVFVGLRFVEGIAGACVLGPARAIVADSVGDAKRGRAYGLFEAFFNAGFLFGPAFGGLIAGLGYGEAFIGSFAVRVVGLILAITLIPDLRSRTTHHVSTHGEARLFSRGLIGAYILAFGDYIWLGFDLTLFALWFHNNLGAAVVVIGIGSAAWALPSILVSPIGGRVADRFRRWRLILIFGLAQIPFYVAYGLISSIVVVIVLIAAHSIVYSFMMPSIDAYLAAMSPAAARARVQSVYATTGLAGAFLASAILPILYGYDYRLPFFVMGAVFGLCVLIGTRLVRHAERKVAIEGTAAATPMTRPAEAAPSGEFR